MKAEELTQKPRYGYVGWELPEHERARLLAIFEPAYPDVIAHHVTLKNGVRETYPLPTQTRGEVVGVADDGHRVQALVVMIGGETHRPDHGTFHVTWSIDRGAGAKPFHSNDCIAAHGFVRLEKPIPIKLEPKFFPQVQN